MMNDLYKLLFFTPTTHKSLGLISDNKLKNIHNYLVDVDLLTLRLAQLKYNTRVRNNEADWWDDLEVYIGLPTYNVRNLDLLDLSTSVPFGLLYDILNISTSNQNISILHKWNIFDVDELCHTEVDEFSMYCLAQEYNIEKSDGIFANYSQKIWGIPQGEIIEQLVDHTHKNLIKKKEIIFFNKSDLLDEKKITEKLKEFKRKVKSKYEIISVFSKEDIKKIKKLLIKNAN